MRVGAKEAVHYAQSDMSSSPFTLFLMPLSREQYSSTRKRCCEVMPRHAPRRASVAAYVTSATLRFTLIYAFVYMPDMARRAFALDAASGALPRYAAQCECG